MKFQRELDELSQLISLIPFDMEHGMEGDSTVAPQTNSTGKPTDVSPYNLWPLPVKNDALSFARL